MSINLDVSALSSSDLAALAAQIAGAKKVLKDQENERLGTLVSPIAEDIVTNTERSVSDMSGWQGFSAFAIPVTVDGVLYHARLNLTDVVASEAAKAEIKAKSGPAYDAHLLAVAEKAKGKGTPTPDPTPTDDTDTDAPAPEPANAKGK